MSVEQRRNKNLPTSEGAWTAQSILNATSADWEKGIKEFFNIGKNKGGIMKKKMNMGGMMNEKKINPTTGLAMNKGGMSTGIKKAKPVGYNKGGMNDMRKTGMMYGGMASKRGK